jgi:RNA:NAD 2'-phosphotransferase (TPT1/KptA family)
MQNTDDHTHNTNVANQEAKKKAKLFHCTKRKEEEKIMEEQSGEVQ